MDVVTYPCTDYDVDLASLSPGIACHVEDRIPRNELKYIGINFHVFGCFLETKSTSLTLLITYKLGSSQY